MGACTTSGGRRSTSDANQRKLAIAEERRRRGRKWRLAITSYKPKRQMICRPEVTSPPGKGEWRKKDEMGEPQETATPGKHPQRQKPVFPNQQDMLGNTRRNIGTPHPGNSSKKRPPTARPTNHLSKLKIANKAACDNSADGHR